jgi:nitrite reductase (cytochrome c-552)
MREAGSPAEFYKTPFDELIKKIQGEKTGIGCADCHDSKTMELKISRPAFKEAMEERGIDLSKATRQEMRSYICAQCHVEYYFNGDGNYLTFPWKNGLKIDNIESYYDGQSFKDWVHPVSKAPLVKIQHPDFELWSTGVHARSGVSCADCHMPYKREGGIKVSDHWVKSPLKSINQSCQTCHRWSEDELKRWVEGVQDRTAKLMKESEIAILDAIDAIKESEAKGASEEELKEARALHRRAHIRWDFISAENSMGFHSPQEAARILGEAIDFARQAQIAAIKTNK